MKEHPIIFSPPMVRAILAGSKTQTRRVVKLDVSGRLSRARRSWNVADPRGIAACPYGQPGDRLWVRESFKHIASGSIKNGRGEIRYGVAYKADRSVSWKPSIHMPRYASRITLEVADVRVERLQDISDADAEAEGLFKVEIDPGYWPKYGANPFTWAEAVEHQAECFEDPRLAYRALWEQINGAGSWDANPWVWVISFRLA